jgi:hypothetical protein
MLHSESIRYLEKAGYQYKPAESPDLWGFLESHFAGPRIIGPKFVPMPASFVAELIAMGEEALLEAMVAHHRKTGNPGRVARVIDLPYVVGTMAAIPLAVADTSRVLRLVSQPGTPHERLIHVVPSAADDIPTTSRMTVTGGLYPDGRTAGYYDLSPGEHLAGDGPDAKGAERSFAYLATPDEIAALAHEMKVKSDDIAIVSGKECQTMITKALAAVR